MSQTTTETASTTTQDGSGGQTTTNGGQGSGSGITEPWAKSWIQPDFTLDHKALDRLPDHLKSLRPTLERQKNFEGVLGALDHAQMIAGKKALAPLPPEAPETAKLERKTLLDTINGVPASPKDYGISRPKDFPEAHWNQSLADKAVAWAHKNSVPPSAMKELVFEINGGEVKSQLAAQEQNENQFWAKEQQRFDSVVKKENIGGDRASALVEKGAIALGLDLTNEQTKTFLKGADARLMAMRHAIAIGEDRVITGEGENSGGTRDYAAEATDIQRNPANPEYAVYRNKDQKYSRAQQDSVVAKVNRLHALAAEMATKGKR